MMLLIDLSENDGIDIYNMLQRIGENENSFRNEVKGKSFDYYKKWLVEQKSWACGESLPDGYVRQWTYWLYDDEIPVGYGKLREKVTEQSRVWGGNIGFAIDPIYRGKGYGTYLFNALLQKGREKHLDELFSTVEKYNYASKRVHEICGGTLVKETDETWYFDFSTE